MVIHIRSKFERKNNCTGSHFKILCNNYQFLLFGEDVEERIIAFSSSAQREDAST